MPFCNVPSRFPGCIWLWKIPRRCSKDYIFNLESWFHYDMVRSWNNGTWCMSFYILTNRIFAMHKCCRTCRVWTSPVCLIVLIISRMYWEKFVSSLTVTTRDPFQYPIGRRIVRSRAISKSRHWLFEYDLMTIQIYSGRNDINNWFCQSTTRIWDHSTLQMYWKLHIFGSKKYLSHAIQKRSSKRVREYHVLHPLLRNSMSLFIKIVFLV